MTCRPAHQPRRLSVGNKLARAMWNLVWLFLYRPSPVLLHGWRRFLLRMFGAKIGRGAHPYPSAKVWAPWNLTMGEHSCLSHYVDCYSVDRITLGAHTTVSQYSFLCTANHDYTDPAMPLIIAPITLGNRVWVTADVFVAPGVTIGDGAVITARSSVFHDIEPWTVAAGNPAQAVKPRLLKGGRVPTQTTLARPFFHRRGEHNPSRPGAQPMMDTSDISGYQYTDAGLNHSHDVLLPTVFRLLDGLNRPPDRRRLFELGCGNGSVAHALTRRGWDVTGVDPSAQGIAQAQNQYSELKLYSGSAYDNLAKQYGQFPAVLSLEVVEHVYFPRHYAATLFSLIEEGGTAIISTPYHGYWKNLAMALSGTLDQHFTALWDHGHIKFWSMRTLSILLEEAGFSDISFERVGRIPALAKSMIAIARRPG